MGAQMVREVASKTNDVAGDGTTTATVLAQAIVREGHKAVAAGMNPMDVKRGVDMAAQAVVSELNKIEGVKCRPTDGTFYVFPSFKKFIELKTDLSNDSELALYILEKAKVAVVPGSAFGIEGPVSYTHLTLPTTEYV